MNKWLNRTANLFLMLLCSECLLRLIQESFHLTVAPKAYGWLALLCVLLWAAVSIRRCFFPGVSAAVGVLWYLIRYSEEVLSRELLDILLAVRSYWPGGLWSESSGTAFQPSAGNHTLALLLILFIAVVYLAMVLSGESVRISLSLLLTLPIVALCLAVNRNPPAFPLLGMCLFWAELIISGDGYRVNNAAGRAVLLTLLPCLAVLGVSLYFNSPSNYVPENKALQLSQRLEQLSGAVSSVWDNLPKMPQMFQVPGRQSDALSGWDGGQDTLDLSRPYDFSARGHEVFTFRGSADGSLYLRGRSLGSYTGTGWSKAEEIPDSQALNYAACAVSSAAASGSGTVRSCDFAIEADRLYDTLYLPYFTVTASSGDTAVPAEGRSAYAGQCLLLTGGSFGPLPESLQWEELQYRSFAREYYTRLPESTRSALTALALQNGLNAADDNIIAEVAAYVSRGSIYDLGVDPYPDDDYALYFLQSARRGYCIHYATAACCLYRALGIPARLCEGFLITAHAGSETIVRAADAHAWVEVWRDGVGWVPVEVTYGAGSSEGGGADPTLPESESEQTDDGADHTSLPDDQKSGSTDTDSESGLDSGGTGSAETAQAKGSDGGESTSDPESRGMENGEFGSGASNGETPKPEDAREGGHDSMPKEKRSFFRTHRILLTVLGVLAVAALAVVGRYLFVRNRLRRRLNEADGRLRAVYLYREAQRVLRFGGEMPEAVLTAAEKASFSPHSISDEELSRSLEALNALTERVQADLSPLRRLMFRYHLGL